MGTYHNFSFDYDISSTQELPEGFPADALKLSVRPTSKALYNRGCILTVSIKPAYTIGRTGQKPPEMEPVICQALVDTGAHTSAITTRMAEKLGLISVGTSDILSATGHTDGQVSDVIFGFPGSGLSDRVVRVHTFDLRTVEYDQPIDVLIGRDIMQYWSIMWHGLTSTVLISD